jgi:hypothetical protein
MARKALALKKSKGERRKQRAEMGTLRQLLVGTRAQKKYNYALELFFNWLDACRIDLPDTNRDLEAQACAFVEALWEEGESKSLAGDFLSSFKTMAPQLRSECHGFSLAWSLFTAWGRNELPERATPFDEDLILAMTCYAIQVQRNLSFGVALFLGFRGLLRVGEICGLRVGKIFFAENLSSAVLELGFTKGGQRRGIEERITIDDADLVRLLFILVEDKKPGDFTFTSTANQFRSLLAGIVQAFGLSGMNFKTHSLRRGGATHLFRLSASYDRVMEMGRWSSQKTCRIYVAEAVSAMNAMMMPKKSKLLIVQYADQFMSLVK